MSLLKYSVICTVLFCVVYGQQNCNKERHQFTEAKLDPKLVRKVSRTSRCMVRETIVELETEFGKEVFPNKVAVKRCTGVSSKNTMTCMSMEKRNVTMAVTGVGAENDGKFYNFEIDEDTKCMMKCMKKEEDCNDIQVYKKEECRCICTEDGSEACHTQPNMKWDQETCKCVCNHEMQACPEDYYWVPAMCNCKKMMNDE